LAHEKLVMPLAALDTLTSFLDDAYEYEEVADGDEETVEEA
jgi:hypothetical protein